MHIGCGASIFPSWLRKGGGPAPSTLLNGLVSYWNLDELSGTRYDSIVASGNDLTDNNTVGYSVQGPVGTVADIVGASSEYLSSTAAGLDIGGDFTYAVWYKWEAGVTVALMSNDPAGSRGITGGFDASSALLDFWYVADGNYNHATYAHGTSTTDWHLAWYWRDGNTIYCTIDNHASTGSAAVVGTSPAFGDFNIANGQLPGYDGKVGPVAVWNQKLDAATRASIFNSGRAKKYADLTASEKTGLVSYWNLDEANGQRNDSHGTNHLTDNNTVGSATAVADAIHNVAASFVDGNVETLTNTSASLDITGDFSCSLWVRRTATGVRCIAGKTNAGNEGWLIYTDGTNYLFYFGTAVSASLSAGDLNTWAHILATFDDATNTMSIYVNNGVPATASSEKPTVSANPFTIGWAPNYYWNGQVDEVAIWSRVLTSDERTELYAAGAGKFYPFA